MEGEKKCSRKSLSRIRQLSSFNSLEEIHKALTLAGVSASRATTHRCSQEMGCNFQIPCINPVLKKRQWPKHLTCWLKQERTKLLVLQSTACTLVKDFFIDQINLHYIWTQFNRQRVGVQKYDDDDDDLDSPSSACIGPLSFFQSKVSTSIYFRGARLSAVLKQLKLLNTPGHSRRLWLSSCKRTPDHVLSGYAAESMNRLLSRLAFMH